MGQRVAAVLRLNVGQHPRGGLAHLTVRVPGLRAVRVRLFLLALTAAQARSRHGVRLIIVSRRSGRPECPDLWRPDRPGRPLPAIRNDGSGVGHFAQRWRQIVQPRPPVIAAGRAMAHGLYHLQRRTEARLEHAGMRH
jgi:hypothetical protein